MEKQQIGRDRAFIDMDREILRPAEPAPKVSAPPAASPDADLVAFHRRYRLGLVWFAVPLVGDQGTAEDVVQDVFPRLRGGVSDIRTAGHDKTSPPGSLT
ncbi:hypothetical protein [Streptosporangium pseudovulgare]|uniref:RNA polymerase sigma-70 region 2 domain-containing protein n=1 Tax=Streptosporangium pseudovulgare TaxID=35765 RepID=A0ABQ2RDU9_9ACTN|nr:hypothetical protein [Streptosporangium pseudovulgare]GGQ22808.1 hypothetical protein GCM10010140_61490 [Streptosporangium pseudovulgare]